MRKRLEKFLLLTKECENFNLNQNLIRKMKKKYTRYFQNFDFNSNYSFQENHNSALLTKIEFKFYSWLFKYFGRDKIINFAKK